jgi:Stage II sporulation protein E (SpoIIE)
MTGTAESSGPIVVGLPPPDGASDSYRRDRWPSGAAVLVLVIGLVVTGVLTSVSAALYSNNEKQLLVLRGRELGAVLTEAEPNVQTPLASAAALAAATDGNSQNFKRFAAADVGQPPRHEFVSLSLWRVRGGVPTPIVVVGATPTLPRSSAGATSLFRRAEASHTLAITEIPTSPTPRLGYAFEATGPSSSSGGYVVYGESMISANRRSRLEKNQAFSELNYAIYLGRSATNHNLLVTSLSRLPVMGTHSTLRIPFGDTALTLVVAARQPLQGTLPERLPWIILIAGLVLSLSAALLTSRLKRAVDENRRLYAEQRTIAQTLQHSLLPATLPSVPGLRASGRYQAGAEHVDVGGDWYDLITLDDGRLLLVVGDVSGRGLPAATTMAALRFAIQAYAAEGNGPEAFLPKLSRLLSVTEDKLLATVLCAVIDVPTREVSVTSAGHLPPLMISREGSGFVNIPPGLPVGIDPDASYTSTTVTAPPGATLLAFTDGLVERRGESIEVGLERLRREADSNHVSLEALLTRILRQVREDAFDDTAVAGIQWLN